LDFLVIGGLITKEPISPYGKALLEFTPQVEIDAVFTNPTTIYEHYKPAWFTTSSMVRT